MRNGSNRKDLKTSTSRRMGKNERAYSTMIGSATTAPPPLACAARLSRAFLRIRMSISQMTPVTAVAMTSNSAKSNVPIPCA